MLCCNLELDVFAQNIPCLQHLLCLLFFSLPPLWIPNENWKFLDSDIVIRQDVMNRKLAF